MSLFAGELREGNFILLQPPPFGIVRSILGRPLEVIAFEFL
jgi:hypothetical protein